MTLYKNKFSENLLVITFILLFALLSTKYKLQYSEAFRPLYSAGLVLSFLSFFWLLVSRKYSRQFVVRIAAQPQFFLFLSLIIYMMIVSSYTSYMVDGRQIKDALYFSFWVVIIPLYPLIFSSKRVNPAEIVYLISKATLIFSIFSILIAYLIFFNILNIQILGVDFSQSIYLKNRIHGLLGESTSLAALIGLSVLSLYYINQYKNKSYKALYLLLLIFIIFTGSRNALVSLIAVYFTSTVIERINLRKMFKAVIYLCLIVTIFVIVFFTTDYLDFIKVVFFDRPDLDLDNKFSRLYIWSTVFQKLSNSSAFEFLFGHGAYELRRVFGAGFNTVLELIYDYGLLATIVYLLVLILSFYTGLKKYKNTGYIFYKYGILLITYGFVFSMFMSYFPTTMFNFSVFSLVFGILITCTPSQMIKTPPKVM